MEVLSPSPNDEQCDKPGMTYAKGDRETKAVSSKPSAPSPDGDATRTGKSKVKSQKSKVKLLNS
ncbi:MAG: hypothetical protein SAK29_11050 [Scytonema sp. PMC 1069.18]|nr:hypothetical protein [Scytonema sp. PMC 1069.18]MEC4882610.1 hypothetical protein [Scytonema sp. PMC 1070.18]